MDYSSQTLQTAGRYYFLQPSKYSYLVSLLHCEGWWDLKLLFFFCKEYLLKWLYILWWITTSALTRWYPWLNSSLLFCLHFAFNKRMEFTFPSYWILSLCWIIFILLSDYCPDFSLASLSLRWNFQKRQIKENFPLLGLASFVPSFTIQRT